MYIYAEKITPRLQYIAAALFTGIEVTLTSSSQAFFEYRGPKINYSKKRFSEEEFLVLPNALLSEAGINKQQIHCTDWSDIKIFFQTKGDIPFDIFSAAFYLISRYEEYLPHKKDSYGRFAHEGSLAFKEGFLQLPLVNLWMQQFYLLLQEKFADLHIPGQSFLFTPTYDIDIAFAYRGQGLLKRIINKLKREKLVVNGRDVFDVYDWMDELHRKHHLNPIYFFLLANRRSQYDKNISPRSKELKQLIKNISAKYPVGVHPSWQSYHDEAELQKEKNHLQEISGKAVINSRQHYIQFTLPRTYRSLMEAGITNDHSMGYGSINGFRASFASPFYWYDLMKEEAMPLLLHPFCFMEANSSFEQKFTAEEAASELQYYHDIVKRVNGHLITIFHNHFLTEQLQWQPWRKMYGSFLEKNFPKQRETTSPSLLGQL
jgi:hypothetical protein